MKKILLYSLLIVLLPVLGACDNFLDVTPADSLTEEQIETSESALNSVLNGIYMNMSKETLYGGYLTKSALDIMAQRYTLSSISQWYKLGQYAYTEKEVQNYFSYIWSAAYTQILDINEFIKMVDNTTLAIPQNRKDILLGEAYALRAFHHFDLLRIFGPVYNSADSISPSIPYQDEPGAVLQDLLPATEVMKKILKDLTRAESLLSNDPIISNGIVTKATNDPIQDFYIYRNYRMNYYAVKALQARAYLWCNDKTNALYAAQTVINVQQSKKYFDWMSYQDIIRGTNPDRVFSPEVIFGLDNRAYGSSNVSMYVLQDKYFAAILNDRNLLYTRPNRLTGPNGWFENESDYRYKYLWIISSTGGKSYRTFFKYEKPTTDTLSFAYFQPVLRITEMYYIVAECNPNYSIGADLINIIRPKRGMNTTSISSRAALDGEIQKEYIREFYGEGQLFFYYKRLNKATIDDGSQDSGTISMDASKYRVPLPNNETIRR